jgi:anti-sigma factor RsiW
VRFLAFRRHHADESDLSAYIDDALSEVKRARVEAHLRSCDDCARKVAKLKQLVAELHALPEAKAPRSFALTPESVAALSRQSGSGLERQKTVARRAYLGLSGATAAAALLLVAAFGADLFVVSNGSGEQPNSLPVAASSSDKSLGMPQAAAALPDATASSFGALQPGATTGNAGQAPAPPIPPSGTAVPGEVIAPPATPEGGQAGGGAVGSGEIAPPPLPIGTPGENVEPPLNVPNVAATAVPNEEDLFQANQPTAATTPSAPVAALPAASPSGVATAVPSLAKTSELGPQAQPAEKSASHAWLWALEGVAGGLFIGFGSSAFWMRRRWVRINRDS